jgi:tRNA/rRNA methyltransferase
VHRIAIELINPDETEVIASDRAARQGWLEARGYRVIDMHVADVEGDVAAQLDRLEQGLLERR